MFWVGGVWGSRCGLTDTAVFKGHCWLATAPCCYLCPDFILGIFTGWKGHEHFGANYKFFLFKLCFLFVALTKQNDAQLASLSSRCMWRCDNCAWCGVAVFWWLHTCSDMVVLDSWERPHVGLQQLIQCRPVLQILFKFCAYNLYKVSLAFSTFKDLI